MSAREFVMIVKESSLGTPMASPVAGTDKIYIRLTDSNSFSMVADPVLEYIPYGGGLAIDADLVADHYECKGVLKTKLYPTQAQLLLNWGLQRINAGQTAPWTTTEPAGDLASCSVYHAVMRSDGTFKRTRFSGVKVIDLSLNVSRKSTGAALSFTLQACRSYGNAMDATADPDATEFPAPADSDFPTGPYTFSQTSGHVTVGTLRTQYSSLDIKVANAMDPVFFETAYLTSIPFLGRKSTADVDLLLKASPDDRTAFEAVTAQSVSLGFMQGTASATINFQGKNRISKLPYELPLNKQFMQKLSLMNLYDGTAGADLTLAFT